MVDVTWRYRRLLPRCGLLGNGIMIAGSMAIKVAAPKPRPACGAVMSVEVVVPDEFMVCVRDLISRSGRWMHGDEGRHADHQSWCRCRDVRYATELRSRSGRGTSRCISAVRRGFRVGRLKW